MKTTEGFTVIPVQACTAHAEHQTATSTLGGALGRKALQSRLCQETSLGREGKNDETKSKGSAMLDSQLAQQTSVS